MTLNKTIAISNLAPLKLLIISLTLGLAACSPPNILFTFDQLKNLSGDVHTISATNPSPIPTDLQENVLPDTYWYKGRERDTASLLRETGTAGLVIVHNDKVIHEAYDYGNDERSTFASWSVAKSFTSALVGIAIEDGYINSVEDLVVDYVPELATTAYATSTIEDVLEMASGVDFSETYMIGTDVWNLQLAIGGNLEDEVTQYVELKNEPGTFNAYKSLDTQVLGLLLVRATGQTVSSYLETRLWEPAGMTNDATWLADKEGLEATFCCLQATTRDFAKLGLIYLNNGYYNGQQIINEQWISASLDTSKPHLQPGNHSQSDYDWGYGYQWWFRDERNDYSAVGIFNQFVYIDPEKNLVIAKNSAAPMYLLNDRENEHFALFRAIGDALNSSAP
ncbi:MAG: beta-lactamase family protein [Pseudomonadales bacterium]|nr:beta-lactamase family protein [Pseudomonadales bacterium]